MILLTIAVESSTWRLMFRDIEKAEGAYAELTNAKESIQVTDDFDQKFFGKPTAVLFENFDKTKLAHCEIILHGERIKADAVKMMNSDPSLRANRNDRGPAIFTPMGNGSRPPF